MFAVTPDAQTVDEAVRILDLTGVLANAILGGIAARSARLDLIGFIALAILSGLGGGMIRDALLQAGPVAALADPLYLIMALIGAAIAFVIPFQGRFPHVALTLLDALSLGCWANVGAQKTLDLGLGILPAVLMGALTAVGGSTVRDVMLRKVPTIFGGNTLNASSALLASVLTVVFYQIGNSSLGSVVAIVAATAVSLLSRRFGWTLPTEVHAPKPARRASAWLHRWWGGTGGHVFHGRGDDGDDDVRDGTADGTTEGTARD